MLQESVTWDPQHIIIEPSTSSKVYMLFLFGVCVVAAVKLIRVWRAAPPFRLSRQANNPPYLQLLRTSTISLTQWTSATFLAWGILASFGLYDVCDRMLGEKQVGSFAVLLVIQDFSVSLVMALLVVSFLFLVRWHMLNRTERLRRLAE